MKAPASTLRASTVTGSVLALLTPLCSARTAMLAGMIASKVTTCGAATSSEDGLRFITRLTAGTGGRENTDDLHGDDFHDRHRRKDHRVTDIRSLGRRHLGRIDKNGGISGRAR